MPATLQPLPTLRRKPLHRFGNLTRPAAQSVLKHQRRPNLAIAIDRQFQAVAPQAANPHHSPANTPDR